MRKYGLLLLIVLSGYCYGQPGSPFSINKADFEQQFKYGAGNKDTALNENTDLFSAYYQSSHLLINIMANKKDLKFSFAVTLKELAKGAYVVNVCNADNDCDDSQAAVYVPGTLSASSFPKSGGYNIPNLNLKPLEFIISSVEDTKLPNIPVKAKRIKGHFSGVFATVEEGKIVGSVDPVKGEFDLACLMVEKE